MDSRRDPLLLAGYALVAAVVSLLEPWPVLAIVVAAPLVLLAPGLALTMALDLDGDPELPGRRLVVSVALSLAVVAIGGIIANAFVPLDEHSWLVVLAAVTFLFCGIAALREGRAWADPFPRPATWAPSRLRGAVKARWILAGAVVLLLLGGAATLTEITSRNAYDTPLVQLSLRPLPSGAEGKALLTVDNKSSRAEDLLLKLVKDGSSTTRRLELPASQALSIEENVGRSPFSAVLTKAGAARPIGEVAWNGG